MDDAVKEFGNNVKELFSDLSDKIRGNTDALNKSTEQAKGPVTVKTKKTRK